MYSEALFYTLYIVLYELNHKVLLSKNLCGIFHFNFWFAFIKVYIFVQVKALAI